MTPNIHTDDEFDEFEIHLQSDRHSALAALAELDRKAGDYRVRLSSEEIAHLAGEREIARDAVRDAELKLENLKRDRAAATERAELARQLEGEQALQRNRHAFEVQAAKLQEALQAVADCFRLMARLDDQGLRLLGYDHANGSILTESGWLVVDAHKKLSRHLGRDMKQARRPMQELVNAQLNELTHGEWDGKRTYGRDLPATARMMTVQILQEWNQYQCALRFNAQKSKKAGIPADKPAPLPTGGGVTSLQVSGV